MERRKSIKTEVDEAVLRPLCEQIRELLSPTDLNFCLACGAATEDPICPGCACNAYLVPDHQAIVNIRRSSVSFENLARDVRAAIDESSTLGRI